MAGLLPAAEFADWLQAFLPGIASGKPTDAVHGRHRRGLQRRADGPPARSEPQPRLVLALASRKHLPAADRRIPACLQAAQRHAGASLPHVLTDDYMVTHWLAAYAVLLITAT